MIRTVLGSLRALVGAALVLATSQFASAQTIFGYGVNSAMSLFRFDVSLPATVTPLGAVGAVGFVPEGIDFRPGTNTLYAIDVGPNTTTVYTLDINTGVPTPVGNFTSTGTVNAVNYNLLGNQTFGFDFNPKTVQGDGSMRIRLVSTSGLNMRLNSSTAQPTNVDTQLQFANQNSPFVDAAAYINNIPGDSTGATILYVMDSRNDALLKLLLPNNGIVETVGLFGAGIDGQNNIGFDIFTPPSDIDPTSGGDQGFAVYKRPDAPVGGPFGAYMLYNVNLATGETTNGRLIGPAATPFNFDGGFAVLGVPEPVSAGLVLAACALLVACQRRRD